jgi:hypothetical protein
MAVAKRKPSPAKNQSAARVTKSKNAAARAARKPDIHGVRSPAAPLAQDSSPRSGTVTAGVTDNANLPHPETARATASAFDPFGIARPWMRFCVGLAVTNFAIQARMARAAMFPPNNVLPPR